MTRFLPFALFAALWLTGCSTTPGSVHPAGLPVRFRDERYGLTFYLPAAWRGYSVSVQQLDDERYSPGGATQIVVGNTSMSVLRHPQWQPNAPYQDIPILVFTRDQWDAFHHGELWPSLFAGGTIDELWHNGRFVFAMWSRYNAADEVRGWREVAAVVEQNRAAHGVTRLYPQ